MTDELRERIIAYNKAAAERKLKADDLEALLEKLEPVLSKIAFFLPDEVKAILEKYGYTV